MRNALIVSLLLVLAVIGACASKPDEPTYDNPFDPNGTDPGEGYGLQASASGQAVDLTWVNTVGMGGYKVEWSDVGTSAGDWEILDEYYEPTPLVPIVLFTHEGFTAEKTNWYRVTGYVDQGDGSLPAAVASTPVALDLDALVSPEDGVISTPTRHINIEVLTGVADGVEVSNDPDFTSSIIFAVTPGERATVPWTLPGDAVDSVKNRDDLLVHYRTRMASSIGPADAFSIQALFTPALEIERGLRLTPGGFFMVDSLQVLSIVPLPGASMDSVVRNKIVDGDTIFVELITPPGVDDPISYSWNPAVEEFVDGEVVMTLTSDFGFNASTSVPLWVPTEMDDPEMEILGGSHTTSRDIRVASIAANAGYIVLSEDAEFVGATWVTWADTLDYQLEDVYGTRFLYAAYSNPILAETKVTSALVSLVSPPARVRR